MVVGRGQAGVRIVGVRDRDDGDWEFEEEEDASDLW